MKKLVSLIGIILGCSPALAAEDPPPGFVALLYAIPSDQPCHVWIDRKKLTHAGLAEGDTTGGVLLPEGAHEIRVSVKGFGTRSIKAEIVSQSTSTYLIYQRKTPARQGAKDAFTLEIEALKSPGRGRYAMEIISLLNATSEFTLNDRPTVLRPRQAQSWRGWKGEAIRFAHQHRLIKTFPKNDAGKFSLIVVPTQEGQPTAYLYEHCRYEPPSWLKPTASKE